jgi:hypothetical protein
MVPGIVDAQERELVIATVSGRSLQLEYGGSHNSFRRYGNYTRSVLENPVSRCDI